MASYTTNLKLEKPGLNDNMTPEPFNNNFDKIDKLVKVTSVTLSASGWSGSGPYTQSVTVNGLTESDTADLVSLLPANATMDSQKAYNRAFGIIASGVGVIGANKVTFTVFRKPATTISVGLKGV